LQELLQTTEAAASVALMDATALTKNTFDDQNVELDDEIHSKVLK